MQRVRQQSATQPGKFQLMLQRSRRRRFVCSSQLRRRQQRRLRQQKVRREMQLKSFAVVAGDIKCHSPTATTRLPRTVSLFAPDLGCGCGVGGGVATFCMPQSFVRLFMPSTQLRCRRQKRMNSANAIRTGCQVCQRQKTKPARKEEGMSRGECLSVDWSLCRSVVVRWLLKTSYFSCISAHNDHDDCMRG